MKQSAIIILAILCAIACKAQEKGTSDLSFSLGFETSNEFLNSVEDFVSEESFSNTKASPAFIVVYKYAVQNNWFFYADGAYQSIEEDVIQNSTQVGDVVTRYVTVGFGTEYHYINRGWFQMYSGASIAYTSQSADFTTSADIQDETDGYFNFQVNGLGFRFGRTIAANIELGVGYKGFANAGLSYQF
jgi:hypothetical protein